MWLNFYLVVNVKGTSKNRRGGATFATVHTPAKRSECKAHGAKEPKHTLKYMRISSTCSALLGHGVAGEISQAIEHHEYAEAVERGDQKARTGDPHLSQRRFRSPSDRRVDSEEKRGLAGKEIPRYGRVQRLGGHPTLRRTKRPPHGFGRLKTRVFTESHYTAKKGLDPVISTPSSPSLFQRLRC